jgi:hypothetical protein
LWSGASDFNNAPFSVNENGIVKATFGSIAGWDIGTDGTDRSMIFKRTGECTYGMAGTGEKDHVVLWAGTPSNETPWEYD